MEQSGRNRRQPVANGTAAKTAQPGENRCRGLPPLAANLMYHLRELTQAEAVALDAEPVLEA
jgi:hypothetical protein